MQTCWTTCQPDVLIESSRGLKDLTPCESCFAPANPVILTDIFSVNRDRQCSEPVRVPDPLKSTLINSQQQPEQSESSGYESSPFDNEPVFGNELSPTTNYWTEG